MSVPQSPAFDNGAAAAAMTQPILPCPALHLLRRCPALYLAARLQKTLSKLLLLVRSSCACLHMTNKH